MSSLSAYSDQNEELISEDAEDCECGAVTSSEENSYFDAIIGHIEDIIVGEQFQNLQKNFLEKHCKEFQEDEENKLLYTDIFKSYQEEIEVHLEQRLEKNVPGFSMKVFTEELRKKQEELEGEIFEVLLTFSDFVAFKEMILDYKAAAEGQVADLCIQGFGAR